MKQIVKELMDHELDLMRIASDLECASVDVTGNNLRTKLKGISQEIQQVSIKVRYIANDLKEKP